MRIGTLLMLILLLPAKAHGIDDVVRHQSGNDLYIAGASIQLGAPVSGDAVAAGGTVLVDQQVAEDLLAAGGSITITETVADDVRAAAGALIASGRIGGDAVLAGGTITLSATSQVDGNLIAAGGVVRLEGGIAGGTRVAGGEVVINGHLQGDVSIMSESLSIGPSAVVSGTLHHQGPHPADIAHGAVVEEIIHVQRDYHQRAASYFEALVFSVLVVLSLTVCTLLLLWLVPGLCRRSVYQVKRGLWTAIGLGFLTLILTPLFATLLLVPFVTAPLGIMLFCTYAAILIVGSLVAVASVGDRLREEFHGGLGARPGPLILYTLAAATLFVVVAWIPFLGALVVLVAFIAGVGGVFKALTRMFRQLDNPMTT